MACHEEQVFHPGSAPIYQSNFNNSMWVATFFSGGLFTPGNWSNGILMDLLFLATYNHLQLYLQFWSGQVRVNSKFASPPPRWWKRPCGQGRGHHACSESLHVAVKLKRRHSWTHDFIVGFMASWRHGQRALAVHWRQPQSCTAATASTNEQTSWF